MKGLFVCLMFFISLVSSDLVCQEHEFLAVIQKVFIGDEDNEEYQIWKGTNSTGSLIYKHVNDINDRLKTVRDTVCLEETNYTVYLYSVNGYGWGRSTYDHSRLSILYGDVELFTDTIPFKYNGEHYEKIDTFAPHLDLSQSVSIYYSDLPQESNNWIMNSFDDSDWAFATNSHLPSFNSTTRYYRIHIPASQNPEQMTTFNHRVITKGPFVVYNNEIEVYSLDTVQYLKIQNKYENNTEISFTVFKGYIPKDSSFVVAIKVTLNDIYTNPQFIEDSFSYYGQYLYLNPNECSNNRFYEGDYFCEQPPVMPTYACGNMYDNCVGTAYEVKSGLEMTTIYTLRNNRREWINSYTLTTSEGFFPKTWHLYGSNDNHTWIHLDYQQDQEFILYTYYTYKLNSNRESFNMFKLHVIDASHDLVTLAMFSTHICNTEIISDELHYPIHYYNDVMYHNEVHILPDSSNYNDYKASPPLPQNLNISSLTGLISGIPHEVFHLNFTITATNMQTQKESSFVIEINIESCSHPNYTFLRIIKINMYDAGFEHFEIFNSSHSLILTHPLFTPFENFEVFMCVPNDIYKIHLYSECKVGFYRGATLNIYQYYDDTVYTPVLVAMLDEAYNTDYYIDTHMNIYPHEEGWKYNEGFIPSSDWYKSSYSTEDWSDYIADGSKNSTSDLWLFKRNFSIYSLGDYSSFEIRFPCHGGFILYLNDVELYRQHVPEGIVNENSTADYGRIDVTEWYGITGEIDSLHIGDNTLSILILNKNDTRPDIIDFDSTFQLLLPLNSTRDYLVTFKSTPSSVYAYNLFNRQVEDPFVAPYHEDEIINIYMSLDHVRSEFINQYCFTSSSSSSSYDLYSWSIYGVTPYNKNVLLDTVKGTYFLNRKEQRCFTLSRNHQIFKDFIFQFYTPRLTGIYQNRFVIGEMDLYSRNLRNMPVPPLRYESSHVYTYVNIPFHHNPVSSTLYNFFTISPNLPSPLFIDSTNGDILGTPTSPLTRQEYTVTALDTNGNRVSTSLVLLVVVCDTDSSYLTIMIEGGANALTEGFKIKSLSSDLIIHEEYNFANYSNNTYMYCVHYDNYEFIPISLKKKGWDHSRYYVFMDTDYLVLTGSLEETLLSKSFNISTHMIIPPKLHVWKYVDGYQEMPSNWMSTQFDDSNWYKAETQKIPSFNTISQYYRSPLSFSITTYPAIELLIHTKFGIVVYINGEELFRKNMPDGPINVDTYCVKQFDDEQNYKHSYYISESLLNNDLNIIAIEVHKSISQEETSSFDIYIRYLSEDSLISVDGIPNSDIYNDIQIDNLFDNDRTTLYRSGPRCIGTIYSYTFNNNDQRIMNTYALTSSYTCNTQLPSSWRIEGSIDNESYILLSTVQNQYFTTVNQTIRYVFYNEKSYSSYRIIVTDCQNEHLIQGERNEDCYYRHTKEQGSLIADISFTVRHVNASCSPEDGYNGALEGDYAYKQCPLYYQGIYQRKCLNGTMQEEENYCVELPLVSINYIPTAIVADFEEPFSIIPTIIGANPHCSITPELPNDLQFNVKTGEISGKTRSLFDVIQYTIICSNEIGSVQTYFYLSSVEKSQTPIWVSLVSMFTIILVVVVFIFFVWITKKNEEKNEQLKSIL